MSEYGGIEASDIGDGDILAKTKQNKDERGNIQFKYIFDDGHELKSEWINPDHARKALMGWCDAVRSNMVARAKEAASKKQRPKIVIPEDADVIPPPTQKPKDRDTRKPSIEILEPTEREEYCARPVVESATKPSSVRTAVAVDSTSDAELFVEGKIAYHEQQIAKWTRVLTALQDMDTLA